MRTIFVVQIFFICSLLAERQLSFQFSYVTRCPQDRIATVFHIKNISKIKQTVKLTGGVKILEGDGSCHQSYTNLGITYGSVTPMAFWGGIGVATLGGGWYQLDPGELISYNGSVGAPSGGAGSISGTIEVQEDKGAVTASAILQLTQDSTSGAPTSISPLVINGSRPF